MPREHAHGMSNGLLAALAVDAVIVPKLSRHRLQQKQIVFAQHPKDFERVRWITVFITEGFRPDILIEGLIAAPSLPRICRIRQLPTTSASARWARISAIDHLPGWGRRRICFFAESLGQLLQAFCRGALNFEGIFPVRIAENPLCVLLGGFFHG